MKNYIVPKGEKAQHEIKSEILGLTKSILWGPCVEWNKGHIAKGL